MTFRPLSLRARRWALLPPEHHPMSRALGVVVAIIVLSMFASMLHVVDAALSGSWDDLPATTTSAPAAQADDQASARDTSLVVEMPPGAVDAVSL